MNTTDCKVKQKLLSTTYYPARFDDFIDPKTRRTMVSVMAKKISGKFPLGISKSDDGAYNIVVEEPRLTRIIVGRAMKELSSVTDVEYEIEF